MTFGGYIVITCSIHSKIYWSIGGWGGIVSVTYSQKMVQQG